MSSNTNHTNNSIITRTNYEEYFILYMDGELTAEETAAVENFLAANPDLQEEMEILLSTKLPQDDISIDKSFLLSDSMKLNAVDESLLLYIDDELNSEQKKEIERKINTNEDFYLQHRLLLKTKLDANDKIIYPFKEELYRRTERRISFSAPWLRVAAAAVLIIGVSATLWFNFNQNNTEDPIASNPATPAKVAPQQNNEEVNEPTIIKQEAAPQNMIAQADEEHVNNEAQTKTTETAKTYNQSVVNQEPVQQIAMVEGVNLENRKEINEAITVPVNERNVRQQIINTASVTSLNTTALNMIEASQNEKNDAVATNDKGKTVKGFLRKATRFIERTTNINPVNEDDELLIGVVAIKLK